MVNYKAGKYWHTLGHAMDDFKSGARRGIKSQWKSCTLAEMSAGFERQQGTNISKHLLLNNSSRS